MELPRFRQKLPEKAVVFSTEKSSIPTADAEVVFRRPDSTGIPLNRSGYSHSSLFRPL